MKVAFQPGIFIAILVSCLDPPRMPHQSDAAAPFPPPPIPGTERLVPITSWAEMHSETEATKVEFDLFWYHSVLDGVAYFFRWLGEPRATVLVVCDDAAPTHIECRKRADAPLAEEESATIIAEVTHAFRAAGYWPDKIDH
jgi:hypothetical protein